MLMGSHPSVLSQWGQSPCHTHVILSVGKEDHGLSTTTTVGSQASLSKNRLVVAALGHVCLPVSSLHVCSCLPFWSMSVCLGLGDHAWHVPPCPCQLPACLPSECPRHALLNTPPHSPSCLPGYALLAAASLAKAVIGGSVTQASSWPIGKNGRKAGKVCPWCKPVGQFPAPVLSLHPPTCPTCPCLPCKVVGGSPWEGR